ncbi:hypothetical protein [Flavobacterium sp.]|uniref:hypothetical protein n=1 Tax=Flavobacterium sp. TaxID=239 RepID=UPI0025EB7E68|nr:hypothetical protein [Flavobacterium sp.]
MSSNRTKAFAQPLSNPAKRFLEWKSNDKTFGYYDKSIAESMKGKSADEIKEAANVKIQLPFKFLVLDQLHTVSGWNDATSSGIYSNEVKFISKQVMTVKPFKGNEIAKGLYADIKEKVKNAGGHYVKSIYIMLEDGTLANIQLKGSSVQQWGEFTNKSLSRLPEEWVVVDKAIEGKKGSVRYTTPGFKFGGSLSDSEANQADLVFDELETYLKAYLIKEESPVEVADLDPTDDDDLDFI